jgi:putative Holliday junction resolvase
MTAHALEVVPRQNAVIRVAEIVAELGITQIVVGLPTTLSGQEGTAAQAARAFAAEVGIATGAKVVFVDERFTTVTAERVMVAAGSKRRARRQSLDKVAAAIILQSFLDRTS